MSAPAIDELAVLRRRITAALAAVRRARATLDHCPSIENEVSLAGAERWLDHLLADQRIPRPRVEETH